MRIRLLTCAAIVALMAAACGSDDAATVAEPAVVDPTEVTAPGTGAGPADDSVAAPALAGPGDMPDLDMIDVHTGEAVNLQSLVDGQTPLLLWYWAPH